MEQLKLLTIVIVLAPLFGAIITGIFGRYIGRTAAHFLTSSMVGLSFILSSYLLYGFIVGGLQTCNQEIYVWGATGNINISLGFLLDKLSVLMITVVSFVSLIVHIYTIGYMHADPGYQRFFSYISLFTFGMLMLVLANNFVQLFFGWEAVGVMSYLLIGFWFKKPNAIFANLKAFLVNRVGDLGFLLGIAAVLHYCGSLNYNEVFAAIPTLNADHKAIDFICICLFIGAMAKSAQVPLHVWLPDSMEGPTPISALIHAATMVTAGVSMVARMSPLFEYSEPVLNLITIIGAITCISMAILAVVQRDIKRIIAYSTLSQLGYMVVALGVSAYAAAIFHLVTHAFFKALLFLGAGSVILAMHHEQDIFKMGNLRKFMPITFWCMVIGTVALIGFPATSGFYSKDLIIEAVKISNLPVAKIVYLAVLFSVFFSALYSFRLLFVVFFGGDGPLENNANTHAIKESPKVVWIPLVALAVPSVIIGALLVDSIMHNFFAEAIFVTDAHNVVAKLSTEQSINPFMLAAHGFISAPFVLLILGLVTAWLCYIKFPQLPTLLQKRLRRITKILDYKYGFDLLNENIIMPAVNKLATICWRVGDVFCIDGIMVNGTAKTVGFVALQLRKIQTGYLYHYAFAMITGFFVLLLWFMILH